MSGACVTSVVATFYNEDSGEGLVLTIRGTKEPDYVPTDLKLNIVGDVWNAVPSAIASVVQWTMLPVTLFPGYATNEGFVKGEKTFSLHLYLGTKRNNTAGVLRSTITTRLNEQISGGNPVFLLGAQSNFPLLTLSRTTGLYKP